jgi:hypothetical protein
MVGHEQRQAAATRQPGWIVQYVLGDDTDPPFAYTVGLHDLGLPELNRFARLLIDRRFLGREHVVEYDGGLTFCSYTLRPPIPQAQTLADRASPRAQVVVIDDIL